MEHSGSLTTTCERRRKRNVCALADGPSLRRVSLKELYSQPRHAKFEISPDTLLDLGLNFVEQGKVDKVKKTYEFSKSPGEKAPAAATEAPEASA